MIKFTGDTRHGTLRFLPGPSLSFEDDRAEEYFIKAGWAEATDEEPAVVYEKGTLTWTDDEGNEHPGIDPRTISVDTGRPVLEA